MKKQRFVIVIAVLALLSCMVLAVNQRWRFPLVNRAVNAVLLPVNGAVLAVHDAIAGFAENNRTRASLQAENLRLKKRLEELNSAEYRLALLEADNNQLNAMVGYKNGHPEQSLMPARVIALALGDLHDAYFLDKGTADGVQENMVVVTSEGMAGVVDEVYPSYSRLLLISSSQCRVGAKVVRNESRAVGIVSGQGPGHAPLRMDYLNQDDDIREGDMVVTSGIGGKYPAGIYIGKVSKVTLDNTRLQKVAEIRSSVNLEALDKVFVVTSVDESKRLILEALKAKEEAAAKEAAEMRKKGKGAAAKQDGKAAKDGKDTAGDGRKAAVKDGSGAKAGEEGAKPAEKKGAAQ